MDCEATVATHIPEEQENRGSRCYPRRSRLLAVVAIGLGIFSTLAIATSRREFQRLFVEFDLSPSLLTSAIVSPAFVLALLVITALTIAKEFVPRAYSMADTWNAVVIGLAIASLVMFMVAVFARLVKLIESLS
jgi:hypothetical protein